MLSHQGTTTSAYGYDSQRLDAASGLYDLRARSYDPTTGRFLSRDPATSTTTDPLQLDRYVYAAGNPIMQRDPSGLDFEEYVNLEKVVAQNTQQGASQIGLA
ncbi:MAG TPA: RHS repeat-associated core domain-containing protein, partial [Ktedonobacterales bacterium]|nr:RHS repeat-associated core domain-containing protein [Ktedonobacterales bacterium]